MTSAKHRCIKNIQKVSRFSDVTCSSSFERINLIIQNSFFFCSMGITIPSRNFVILLQCCMHHPTIVNCLKPR